MRREDLGRARACEGDEGESNDGKGNGSKKQLQQLQ